MVKNNLHRGEWRKLHKEKLHNLYSSSNIVSVIKSRRMRWAGHEIYVDRGGMTTKFQSENMKGNDYFRGLGIDGDNIKMYLKRVR
jgi:hypothetical protein